jgi:hypothetical protein
VLQAAVGAVAVAVKADMVPVRSAGSKGFGIRHTSPFWFNQSIRGRDKPHRSALRQTT